MRSRDAFARRTARCRAPPTHFRPRDGQTEMALAVARTIEEGGALVVEAGTGVGKTFSYLVPALLSGERVLLSTATKTLQDQLFGRDLPRLVEALGLPVRTALLKGRGSYLCLHRLELARHDAARRTAAPRARWPRSSNGRRPPAPATWPSCPGWTSARRVIPLVTSTRENCLGAQCPQVPRLPRQPGAARGAGGRRGRDQPPPVLRRPGGARVGHGRAAADGARRGLRRGAPAQRDRRAVPRRAAGHRRRLLDFARDMLAAGLQHRARPGRLAGARGRRSSAPRATCGWSSAAAARQPSCAGPSAAPEGVAGRGLAGRARRRCSRRCDEAPKALDTVSEIAPDFVRLHERAATLAAACRRFARAVRARVGALGRRRPRSCAWSSRRWTSPRRCSTRLLKRGQRRRAASAAPRLDLHLRHAGRRRAPALVHRALRPERGRGAARRQPVRLSRSRPRCTCRASCPKPNDPGHSQAVARLAARGAAALGGRTLVLTTTLRALRTIGEDAAARFERLRCELGGAGAGRSGPSGG